MARPLLAAFGSLNITRSTSAITITWNNPQAVLQRTLSLTPPVTWTDVSISSPYVQSITNAGVPTNAFYRLRELSLIDKQDTPVVLVGNEADEEFARQRIKLGASSGLAQRPGYLYQLSWEQEQAQARADLRRREAALAGGERPRADGARRPAQPRPAAAGPRNRHHTVPPATKAGRARYPTAWFLRKKAWSPPEAAMPSFTTNFP